MNTLGEKNGAKERYFIKVVSDFAENVYQQMVSKRFGIAFCCKTEFDKLDINKQLLDNNAIMDTEFPVYVCPPEE